MNDKEVISRSNFKEIMAYNYQRLWTVEDQTSMQQQMIYQQQAEVWPGFPVNPIEPNPINVQAGNFIGYTRPVPPLGGRHTERGKGYVGLSNYNNLP